MNGFNMLSLTKGHDNLHKPTSHLSFGTRSVVYVSSIVNALSLLSRNSSCEAVLNSVCSITSSELLGSHPEQRVTTKGRVGLAN